MIQKQTVYLPIEKAITNWLKPKEGYFFTPEQLNEYTANVIKQALETAAETQKEVCICERETCICCDKSNSTIQSITNTFEETYKKFEV